MSAPQESLQAVPLGADIQLWKPRTDVLHSQDVIAQDPGCDKVLLGLPFGECGGVKMANHVIQKLGELSQDGIYGNHEPTHGADSTAEFTRLGAQFGVDPKVVPLGMPYVISAHGAAPDIKAAAEERGLNMFDVTCPLVHRTHQAVLGAAKLERGRVAYISFGSPEHPERVGIAGVAKAADIPFSAIANEEDVAALVADTEEGETIVVVGQTTNNSDESGRLATLLHQQAATRGIPVKRENSHDVCHTVRDRQRSTREIVAHNVGSLVVVGSVNSKNTKSLALVAAEEAELRNQKLDIYLTNSWAQIPVIGGRVGVVSGASTRTQNVEGIVKRLAPNNGVTLVGEDTDKGITFSPIHTHTKQLLK